MVFCISWLISMVELVWWAAPSTRRREVFGTFKDLRGGDISVLAVLFYEELFGSRTERSVVVLQSFSCKTAKAYIFESYNF